MADEKRELTRRELYEWVWRQPMTTLAKEFGLSDRGLAKICERNGIPVPARGYWARKTAGQRVVRPPLLDIKGAADHTITISPYWPQNSAAQTEPVGAGGIDPFKELMDRELQDVTLIAVPATLRNPHRIIDGWLEEEERDRARWRSFGSNFQSSYTSCYGTPLAKRRLRIFTALFAALEARGFVVDQDRTRKTEVWVCYEQDKITFDLSERVQQKRRKLTDAERKNKWNPNQEWTQTREETGELVLKITSAMPAKLPSSWRDEPESPLEQKLHFAVVGFIVAAAYERYQREIREEAQRKKWEAEKEAQRREEKQKAELARGATLRLHARSWRRATDIREYVAAVRKATEAGTISASQEDLTKWIDWALTHADALDPIVSGRALTLQRLEIENEDRPCESPNAYRSFGYSRTAY